MACAHAGRARWICRVRLGIASEYAKVVLDVTGVREQRRSKLVEFVTDAAQQVLDDDVEVAFEVMSSLDRKIVHDTVAEIDGVASSSIGEDPRRRVVLKPT